MICSGPEEIRSEINKSDIDSIWKTPGAVPSFVMPVIKKNSAVAGAFSVGIPEGFAARMDENPDSDGDLMIVLPDPESEETQQAALRIRVRKPYYTGISAKQWKQIDEVKEAVNEVVGAGSKIEFVKETKKLLVAYQKGSEADAGEERYWVSYTVFAVSGSILYRCDLIFCSQKTTIRNYTQAVEKFCSKLSIDQAGLKELESRIIRESLGEMGTDNGKIRGLSVAGLYSAGIVFNHENEIVYDGKHTLVSDLQFNTAAENADPYIFHNPSALKSEILNLLAYVDANRFLSVARTKTHPNIMEAVFDHPVTGAAFFTFCGRHLLRIAQVSEDRYLVEIDRNLQRGIPDAFQYVGEFIRTLRAYNEIVSDFEIALSATEYPEAQCDAITTPVKGAVTDDAKTVTVTGCEDFKKRVVLEEKEILPDTLPVSVLEEEDEVAQSVSAEESEILPDALPEEAEIQPAISEEDNELLQSVSEEESEVLPDALLETAEIPESIPEEENELSQSVSEEESETLPDALLETAEIQESEESTEIPEEITEAIVPARDIEKELAAAEDALIEQKQKKELAEQRLEEAEKAYSKLLSEKLIEKESMKLCIQSIKTEIENKNVLMADLDRQIKALCDKKDEYKKKIESVKADNREQRKAKAAERKAIEDRIDYIRKEISGILEEKYDKKTKLESAFLFKRKKQQEYDDVKKRLKEKENEISDCNAEIEQVEEQVEEIKRNTEKEIDKIKGEMSALEERKKELRNAIADAQEAIKNYKEEENTLEERRRHYKPDMSGAEAVIAECKQELAICEEEVKKAEERKKQIQQEFDGSLFA